MLSFSKYIKLSSILKTVLSTTDEVLFIYQGVSGHSFGSFEHDGTDPLVGQFDKMTAQTVSYGEIIALTPEAFAKRIDLLPTAFQFSFLPLNAATLACDQLVSLTDNEFRVQLLDGTYARITMVANYQALRKLMFDLENAH